MTSISCSNATGNLLANIFHNWPTENLLQISNIIPHDEITAKYKNYFKPKGLFDYQSSIKKIIPLSRLTDIYCLNWDNLKKTIEIFKPHVLYTRVVGSPLFYLDISYKLTQLFKLPMACHLMDDYECLFLTSANPFERYVIKNIFSRRLRNVLSHSDYNFSISQKMAGAFNQRYDVPFSPLHNGIDPDLWPLQKRNHDAGNIDTKQFVIVHAGALAPEKEGKVVHNVAQSIDMLNREGEYRYSLILNTQKAFLPFAEKLAAQYKGVEAQGYLPLESYRKLLQNADLLVLARNFDERSRAYTENSFQNKLPEYMISGTPILCIGPYWEYSVEFLKNHSAALVITTSNLEEISNAIKELHFDIQRRKKIARNARNIALSQFNIHTIRNNFENIMCKLADLNNA